MKSNYKTVIKLLFLIVPFVGYSQTKGDTVKLKSKTKVSGVESSLPQTKADKAADKPTNVDTTQNATYLEDWIKYKVIKITDTNVYLQADLAPLKDKDGNILPESKSFIYNNKVYEINRSDFENSNTKIERKEWLSIGLLTLPFKARPQDDFTFDTEFNLNSTLNWSFWYPSTSSNDISVNLQLGAGIGTVGLNTSNVHSGSTLTDTEAQDVSTVTFLTGIMLQYKKVQVGIYVGVDHINNQKNYQWESNGNSWFGFGVGYDLFSVALAKEGKNSSKN